MEHPSEAELDAAEAYGRAVLDREPRASSVRYDAAAARIVLELVDGRLYGLPVAFVQDLQGAADIQLAEVQVDGAGLNLHWPALDVDLYVPALVQGVFGTRDWMAREFARRAGQARSAVKAAASRANGAKGGRPRKQA